MTYSHNPDWKKALEFGLPDTLCFFRWHSGMRMVTRQLSHPPVGTETGGEPACVLVAVWVSTRALTAEGAVDTQSRTSRAHCQLPLALVPSQFLPSNPAKFEISVKSKLNPRDGEGIPLGRGKERLRVTCTDHDSLPTRWLGCPGLASFLSSTTKLFLPQGTSHSSCS